MSALTELEATLAAQLAGELATADARFVVAFSGGADSTALLAGLTRIAGSGRVVALHVDHGLHPDSTAWSRQCEAVGAHLGVRVEARRVDVGTGPNLEARARRSRYAAFAARLARDETLVLAHHADDQAEWLLLRLCSGRPLRPMPVRRPLGLGSLVRPLLGLERARLAEVVVELGLPRIEDPTNADPAFDRGYLRREVIPTLVARWPEAMSRIADQAGRLAQADMLARAALDAELDRADGALPLASLRSFPAPEALLGRFLERAGIVAGAPGALGELERQRRLGKRVGVSVGRDSWLCVEDDAVRLVRRRDSSFPPCRWTLGVPLAVGAWQLNATWCGSGPACVETLDVRARSGGERLRPSGRTGSRSVKRLLQEHGVARADRAGYPLLYDVDARLVAVPDVAVDASVRDRFATGRHARPGAGWRISIERTSH